MHATAIAVGDRAALIRGRSKSGKSDLAFRCLGLGISALLPAPVKLISDDQVILKAHGPEIRVSAPSTLRGKLEVRGVGILEVDAVPDAKLVLVADLVQPEDIDRYPDPWPFVPIMKVDIPLIRLAAFESSSPLKLVTAINIAPQPRKVTKT